MYLSLLYFLSNIIKRADEFAIMRALGMTLKEKYKWIILDNLIIALVAIIINILSAIFIYYNNSSALFIILDLIISIKLIIVSTSKIPI